MSRVRIISNCCIDHDNICYTSADGWFNLPYKVAKYFESKGSVEIRASDDEDVILGDNKVSVIDDLDDIDFDSICTEEVAKEKKQKKNRRRKKN